MLLHLAYPWVLYLLLGTLAMCGFIKLLLMRKTWYTYPATQILAIRKAGSSALIKRALFALRLAALALLALLAARPQWADERSQVRIQGIDIVIALDVSGSMELFDDPHDRQTRIQVAKKEAIRFIEKRANDPIGLVIFAKDALSRCPVTLDKAILKELVGSLFIGVIDPQATALGTGLATAVNRLKTSAAKSKVVILLTDGEPTPGEKVAPEMAIALAKEYGIKVYTVGIGNDAGGYLMHPFLGLQSGQTRVNKALLQEIADKTGGAFFLAHNPQEMRAIYDTINRLEKTDMQTTLFHTFYEAFEQFIWFFMALFFAELLLRLTVWRGIA
ncbi:VWA domain-containing protein [bacterium]|nr:VWA domain-containing protein [bacterium]